MDKGAKKYFAQKTLSEVAMDEYLGSLGLYRKRVARDSSSLFRAVSEQYVEGSFEKYLERLADPRESAGRLEMTALSLKYKRDFIVYRYPGKPPRYVTDNGFEDKILLCSFGSGCYDSVYTEQFKENAAICQAVLYEILYKDVFGVDEEVLTSAVEEFRSGSKKERKSGSVGCEDTNFDCLHENVSRNPSEKRLDNWEGNDTDNPQEDKFKQSTEEEKPPENPSEIPIPYRVRKALDAEIYRNVEFDTWLDIRKELQKTDYLVFAGRRYYLGDKCQVHLEAGGKYYDAHIQEVGQDGNALTVFVEELAEKHMVPLANFKPVTQVAPVLAWSMSPSRKGGSYQKITGGYFSGIEMDVNARKRMPKKVHGKKAFMTVTHSRGQRVLPPRVEHSVPSGCSPPVHCLQGSGHMAPYEPYNPRNPPQRHNRGFGVQRHSLIDPQIAFYPSPGERCYQSYDNLSCGFCRSCHQMQYANKECQYEFASGNGAGPQGPEETITFYGIEGDGDNGFPTLPDEGPVSESPQDGVTSYSHPQKSQGSSVPPNKQTLNSSEEEEEKNENGKFHEEYISSPPDPDCETAAVVSSAEPTANLDEGPVSESPQDGVTSYSHPQEVMVNSAAISSSTGVDAASAAGFPSNSTSTPASVTTAVAPQTAVQPVIVSPLLIGRPAVSSVPFPTYSANLPPISEVGEAGAVLPPYSCDPTGSDLPRGAEVSRYCSTLGLQSCHRSCCPSVVYVQPVLPPSRVEGYPAYAEPAPVLNQTVPQLCADAGRTEVRQVSLEAPANGAEVSRYCSTLGLQSCHRSCCPSVVYVQPVLPPSRVEGYPAYAEPAPVLNQTVPQLCADAGRTEVRQVSLEAPANGAEVSRYCSTLGLQSCHRSCCPSVVYVQPVLPPSCVEGYPAYAEPAPVLNQTVPQLYADAGRTEVRQVSLEAPANGNFQNAELLPLSYRPVYYPAMSDPFSQQCFPGYDSLVPAYRYVSTWQPGNPPYGNSPHFANSVSSGPVHQVNYIASPNPAPPDVPQGM